MEYVYAVLMLHSADREVTEENISKVLEAAGVEVDEARVKALTTALEDVNIDEAIETAAMPTAAPAPEPSEEEEEKKKAEKEEKEEEKEEEEEEEAAEGAAGLGDLFE
ncbi:50S ribosomal protein L12 [candidate division MSBL1 archaeon SCGC-AAA259J03]|uniref:Large ribosomal subunit protein P1 n=3 Tax=candidate division MSBL1 TaxID=215777 RepID=A0A656YZP0_9EURY|nr:50S ribosomal protein L12 [candidate division MSBL1 archaeon SCGC-AAA259J03]